MSREDSSEREGVGKRVCGGGSSIGTLVPLLNVKIHFIDAPRVRENLVLSPVHSGCSEGRFRLREFGSL